VNVFSRMSNEIGTGMGGVSKAWQQWKHNKSLGRHQSDSSSVHVWCVWKTDDDVARVTEDDPCTLVYAVSSPK
tara:strand:+ start:3980 stop:4198 length:219 start_codon:yes stop_codon:yes gene_type:complete